MPQLFYIKKEDALVDERRRLEQEYLDAYFAALTEPDADLLAVLVHERDRLGQRLDLLNGSESERLEEIDQILTPPEPEPEKPTILQRLRRS